MVLDMPKVEDSKLQGRGREGLKDGSAAESYCITKGKHLATPSLHNCSNPSGLALWVWLFGVFCCCSFGLGWAFFFFFPQECFIFTEKGEGV